MYCGHCGAAVEEHDEFCPSCGARFVESTAGAAAGGTSPFDADPMGRIPNAPGGSFGDLPPPTQLIPVVAGPGGRGARPFLIGGAFALIVIAGIVAFFVLRGDDSNAQPAPTGPTSPIESTSTSSNPLPSVATTVPVTPAPSVATTIATPPETPAPTAAPDTTPTSGTVPANTATIPGAPPTSAAPGPTTAAPAATRPPTTRPATTRPPTTRPPTTQPPAATPTTATPTTATPISETPVSGSPTVSAIRASAARASGIDSCGQPTSYRPSNVLDGQLNTAWMTVGDGDSQYLEFTMAPGAQLTQVGLVPGYAKQDPCSNSDRFHDMRRIVEVHWTFDGGGEVTQTLDPESPTMQTIQLPAPTTATTVRLTVTATTDPGTAGFDYAPISEVTLA